MGPVGPVMVQTGRLCRDGAVDDGECAGWGTEGGIEVRCTWDGHRARMVPSSDARAAAGISWRQWDLWCAKGWVRTDPHPGSGRRRFVSEYEVAVVRLMGTLVRAGVNPERAVHLARALWDGETPRLTDRLVVGWEST